MDDVEIGAPADEGEQRAFRAIADYVFAQTPPLTPDIGAMARQGPENYRLARLRGRVVGGLGLLFMGQWFGGRNVPMVGINAVAVAPEHRSTGIATRLLRRVFEDVHVRGVPLSALYPATQPVYRRAGYEQAGVSMGYALPLHGLDSRGHDPGLRLRPASNDGADCDTVRALYAERGRRTAGTLDRNEYMWGRLTRARDTPVNTYLVERTDGGGTGGGAAAAEGYITYEQGEGRGGPGERDRNIVATDLVALTPGAARTLLAFLANHRSTAEKLEWRGGPADPLLLHVPDQGYKVTWYEQWMLRVVDVRGALEARGYAPALGAEMHLEVRDDLLPWNAGRWTLAVAGGRGEVRAGGRGDVRLDVRGLAPLYSGYLSAEELRGAGLVEGPPEALALASLVFAGPSPWMADGF